VGRVFLKADQWSGVLPWPSGAWVSGGERRNDNVWEGRGRRVKRWRDTERIVDGVREQQREVMILYLYEKSREERGGEVEGSNRG